jgi:hypothetical protein
MQHGAGGKWYLNAEHYSAEVVERHNLREFLLEQYPNFAQISVRKVAGFSPVGMDDTFRMPIIGREVKMLAETHASTERSRPPIPSVPRATSVQVVPLEDGIEILRHLRPNP